MFTGMARDLIGRRSGVLRTFVAGVALFSAGMLIPQQAAAFELFGVKLFGQDDDAGDVVDPVRYVVTLNLAGADETVRGDLEEASTLTADEDRPVSGSLGILSKAHNERELLVASLYEHARYDGTVDITIDGRPLDELEPDATFDVSRPVPIVVTVNSGQEFTIGEVTVTGETGGIAPAKFGLMPGGDASSSAILRAENQMVLSLKEEGRPLAGIVEREVIADHRTGTLDVMIALEAGPVAPFGDTAVEGAQTVDAGFTQYMADIERGKTYSPEDIRDARERLLALGVFSSVTVKERDALAADGSIPIDIQVSERKHRFFGVGATVSSTDGAGVEGYWGHRNLFGRAEKLRLEGSINRIGAARNVKELDYKAALLFEKPGVLGPASKFTFDVKFANEHPDAYDRFVFSTGAGISYDLTKQQTLSAQLRVEYSEITNDVLNPLDKKYLLVSTPIEYVFDTRDDKLNPKSGFRLLGYVEPTYGALSGAAFVKARGEASAYKSFDETGRFVLAGRVAAGTIAGAKLSDVPADRRFYSGGGGSVRGYSYQGIGPKDIDPATGKRVPTGGLSYAEASMEMRIQVTDTLGVVPFLDAGTVSQRMVPDFGDMRFGAGIGVRYLTPFGPLRIDAAVPLDRRPGDASFGIYAGIGQAF